MTSISSGTSVEAILKITTQPYGSDKTDIRFLIFKKNNPKPVLANMNEQNKLENIRVVPVQISSRFRSSNKVVIQKSDPFIGFSFIALTESTDQRSAIEKFNFLPNYTA